MNSNYMKETDEKVEKMIKTWDIVRCKICGKKISMLTAKIKRTADGYEYFVCKEH